jgi:hypothetical protein
MQVGDRVEITAKWGGGLVGFISEIDDSLVCKHVQIDEGLSDLVTSVWCSDEELRLLSPPPAVLTSAEGEALTENAEVC